MSKNPDLDPHQAAVLAMWFFGERYAKRGLGSMAFWQSLLPSERKLFRRAIAEIAAARTETEKEAKADK